MIKKHVNDNDFHSTQSKSQNPKYTKAANYDLSEIIPWLPENELKKFVKIKYMN